MLFPGFRYQENVFNVLSRLKKKYFKKSVYMPGCLSTNTLTLACTAWSQQPRPMTAIQIKEWQRRVKRTVPGLLSWTQSHIQWDEVIKQKAWVTASEPFLYCMFWKLPNGCFPRNMSWLLDQSTFLRRKLKFPQKFLLFVEVIYSFIWMWDPELTVKNLAGKLKKN